MKSTGVDGKELETKANIYTRLSSGFVASNFFGFFTSRGHARLPIGPCPLEVLH
jgi:hypothetical protein